MDQSDGHSSNGYYWPPNLPNYSPTLIRTPSVPLDQFGSVKNLVDNFNVAPSQPHNSPCRHLSLTEFCCCYCCRGCREESRMLFYRGGVDSSEDARNELNIIDIKYYQYSSRATVGSDQGQYMYQPSCPQYRDFMSDESSNSGTPMLEQAVPANFAPSAQSVVDDSVWSALLSQIRSICDDVTEQEDRPDNSSLSQQTMVPSTQCSQSMSQSMEIVRRVRELDLDHSLIWSPKVDIIYGLRERIRAPVTLKPTNRTQPLEP